MHRRKVGVFDKTLGFPGEGPPQGAVSRGHEDQKGQQVTVATANITAWNSLIDADLLKVVQADVWAIQEHKLADSAGISKARGYLSRLGYNSSFERANRTTKGGISAGVAWKEGFRTQDLCAGKPRAGAGCAGRIRVQAIGAGTSVLRVGSIYGDCMQVEVTMHQMQ